MGQFFLRTRPRFLLTGHTLAFAGMLTVYASLAPAAVLFSNYAGPDPLNTKNALVIAGSDYFCNSYASSFTSGGNSLADEVDVVVFRNSATDAFVKVGIYADSAGVPGAPLSGLVSVPAPAAATSEAAIFTVPVALVAGQKYWVGLTPEAHDTYLFWAQNPNLAQTVAFSNDAAAWFNTDLGPAVFPGEFQVAGTIIDPEPGSLSLFGLGTGGIAFLLRKRTNA